MLGANAGFSTGKSSLYPGTAAQQKPAGGGFVYGAASGSGSLFGAASKAGGTTFGAGTAKSGGAFGAGAPSGAGGFAFGQASQFGGIGGGAGGLFGASGSAGAATSDDPYNIPIDLTKIKRTEKPTKTFEEQTSAEKAKALAAMGKDTKSTGAKSIMKKAGEKSSGKVSFG